MDFKITFFTALITAVIFGAFSLIFNFGDWKYFWFVFFWGLFVGILMAPEIEPKKFKRGWLLQILTGAVAGIVSGMFFELDIYLVISSGILGGFVGWFAPSWVRHVTIA